MLDYTLTMLRRSRRLFLDLIKVMLPVMLAVKLAEELGLIALAAQSLDPITRAVGLPVEAGIVWVTTALVGMYGGVGALVGLAGHMQVSLAQLSALAAMMLFAHSLPVEQAIVRRAGASFWLTTLLRIGTGLAYGWAIVALSRATGWLAEPVDLSRIATGGGAGDDGWLAWAWGTVQSFALIFAIILLLLLLLDLLDRSGITARITRLLEPLLRVSGLDAQVAPVTTVGVLLGLTYGGGLIIEQAREQNIPARPRFLALAWLSLSHGLIEDTLLMLAMGADLIVILVGRVLLTLLIVGALAKLLAVLPDRQVERWFAPR
ncbi:nucleoside recognition domain-containing protein [Ferrovibrio sp.]|uniref:nucleoside recognition domain-containing protein n=1 Tax=Ferrovibrio sp. TaxID=1917215 RepID=UPI003D0BDA2C